MQNQDMNNNQEDNSPSTPIENNNNSLLHNEDHHHRTMVNIEEEIPNQQHQQTYHNTNNNNNSTSINNSNSSNGSDGSNGSSGATSSSSTTMNERFSFLTSRLKQSKTYRNMFRKILGLLCILIVVILWVLGGEAIQLIYSDLDYEKPFLVTYISTSLFSIYLCGFLFIGSWRRPLLKSISWLSRASLTCCLPKSWVQRMGISNVVINNQQREYTRVDSSPSVSVNDGSGSGGGEEAEKVTTNQTTENDINVGKTFRLAVVVTFFWFFSNTAYNYALLYTSVASDTIISNTSCLFTFIVGLLIGVETHFSVLRFIAILVTLTGVALVTLSDHSHNASTGMRTDTFLGNMLSLLAAMGYGVFSSLLKKYEEGVSMAMMFGFVGLLNLIFNWPILFILWGLGVEAFQVPSFKVFIATVLNSLISSVFSDLLWALAVVLTSPVIATVGLTLTIPFAIICDMLIRSDYSALNVMYAFGTIFVLFGFVAVNVSYNLPKRVLKYDQPFFCSVEYLVQKVKPRLFPEEDEGTTILNSNKKKLSETEEKEQA